jgi:hypothetical protein
MILQPRNSWPPKIEWIIPARWTTKTGVLGLACGPGRNFEAKKGGEQVTNLSQLLDFQNTKTLMNLWPR